MHATANEYFIKKSIHSVDHVATKPVMAKGCGLTFKSGDVFQNIFHFCEL